MSMPPGMPTNDTAALLEQIGRMEFGSDLPNKVGPILMGITFDLMLCGVVMHQFSVWLSGFSDERLFHEILVISVCGLGIGSSCFTIYFSWVNFVAGFGKFAQFLDVYKYAVFTLLDGISNTIVQVFYIERAYRLHRNAIWVPLLLTPLMITSMYAVIQHLAVAATLNNALEGGVLSKFFYIWLSVTVAIDGLLTGVITFGLWRTRTGWSNTDRIINKLIKTSVEAQLPATVTAIVFITLYAVKDYKTTAIIMVQLAHPKVYVVSLLAVLNYRYSLRRDLNSDDPDSTHKNSNTFALSSRKFGKSGSDTTRSQITYAFDAERDKTESTVRLNRQDSRTTSDHGREAALVV